jgi:hypothetical protein
MRTWHKVLRPETMTLILIKIALRVLILSVAAPVYVR